MQTVDLLDFVCINMIKIGNIDFVIVKHSPSDDFTIWPSVIMSFIAVCSFFSSENWIRIIQFVPFVFSLEGCAH